MSRTVMESAPTEVVRTRSLIGAWSVVSVLQYFLAEAVVISAWAGPQPYSRRINLISDLGALRCAIYDERFVCSPLHPVMNASFILQGSAMIVGAALVSTVVLGVSARGRLPGVVPHPAWLTTTRVLIAVAGFGTILVGFVPEDLNEVLHYAGAFCYFVAGGLALVIIGWSWRRLHWTSWVILGAGALSLGSAIVFSLELLPELGTLERLMGYPITIGLAVVGLRVALTVYRARAAVRAALHLRSREAASSSTDSEPA
jgi:hypothetical protein